MSEAKPFSISKWEVWEAYKRVKANQGAADDVDQVGGEVGEIAESLVEDSGADAEGTAEEVV